jgi:hypothetical protein
MKLMKSGMLKIALLAGLLQAAGIASAGVLSNMDSGAAANWAPNPPTATSPFSGYGGLTSFFYVPFTDSTQVITLAGANYTASGSDMLTYHYAINDNQAALAAIKLGVGGIIYASVNLTPTTSPTGTNADWRSFSVSLNYLSNLGVNLASQPAITLNPYFPTFYSPYTTLYLALNTLETDNPNYTSIPNAPDANASAASGCGTSITLSLGNLASNGGTFPAAGYHIYRSTDQTTWKSAAYTTSTTVTSWVDTGLSSGTYYYKVLVYDTIAAGINNTLMVANPTTDAPAVEVGNHFGAGAGVDEALLSAATQISANLTAPVLPVPTPVNVAATGCNGGIEVSWDPVTSPGCNSIQSYILYRATYASYSVGGAGVISVATQSGTNLNDTSVTLGQVYYYRIVVVDTLGNQSPLSSAAGVGQENLSVACLAPSSTPTPNWSPTVSFTPSQTPTPSQTSTVSVTFTDTRTVTPIGTSTITPTLTVTATPTFSPTGSPTTSPTLVPTPVPKISYLYPNPFHPDRPGEVFHIKPNSNYANSTVTIYDMVGRKVRSFTSAEISGGSSTGWDGRNQNGVLVVSGIYFLVVSGDSNVYRIGVIRQ